MNKKINKKTNKQVGKSFQKNDLAYSTAFTLAEMMVVLLITSILVAAFMPILTRRLSRQAPADVAASHWEFTDVGNPRDIRPTNDGAVAIGTGDGGILGGDNGMLLLNSSGAAQDHILFKDTASTTGILRINSDLNGGNVFLGNNITNNVSNGNTYGETIISQGVDISGNSSGATIITNTQIAVQPGATSVAIGPNIQAVGGMSVAIGNLASAGGYSATAIGQNSNAAGAGAIAIGLNSSSQSDNSVAIGNNAKSEGVYSLALGTNAKTIGTNATAIGSNSILTSKALATGDYSTAIGVNADSDGNKSIAIGCEVFAYEPIALVIGSVSSAFQNGLVIGNKSVAGKYSIAIGNAAHASADMSIAIGYQAIVDGGGDHSVALGAGAHATKSDQTVIGTENDTVHMTNLAFINFVDDPETGMKVPNSADGVQMGVSDKRLKAIKGENTQGLAQIRTLTPYRYTFKDDKEKTPLIGVMAQDLQKVIPRAVTKGGDGYLRVEEDFIFYAMINSVKQLDEIVAGLVKNLKSIFTSVQTIDDKIINMMNIDKQADKKIEKLEARRIKLEARVKRLEALAKASL